MPGVVQNDGLCFLDFDPNGDLIITFEELCQAETSSFGNTRESSGFTTPTPEAFDLSELSARLSKLENPTPQNDDASKLVNKPWRCRVSSAKLKVIPKLLSPKVAAQSEATLEVTLPYRHREPMSLILHLVHKSAADLPKCILPLTLTRLAEYVDEFGLGTMISAELSRQWLSNVKLFRPTNFIHEVSTVPLGLSVTCSDRISPWLNIDRVFGTAKDLQKTIMLATGSCAENMDRLQLEIPKSITTTFEAARAVVIPVIMGLFKRMLNHASSDAPISDGCTFAVVQNYQRGELFRVISKFQLWPEQTSSRAAWDRISPGAIIAQLRYSVSAWNLDNTYLHQHIISKNRAMHNHSDRQITKETVDELSNLLFSSEHSLTVHHYLEMVWATTLIKMLYFLFE